MPASSRVDGPCVVDTFTVRLRPATLALARASVHSIHAVCVVYYVLTGLIYRHAEESYSLVMLESFHVTITHQYFDGFAVVHFVLAACHGHFLLYRGLRFLLRLIHQVLPSQTSSSRSITASFQRVAQRPAFVTLSVYGHAVHKHLFSRRGFFGVEYHYFNQVFFLRETIELILQTYQGYTMSLVLPRRVLKGFYVGLLVLNCWLPSIVHRFVENEATRRLLCRMGDTVLDFLSSIGVSVIIAVGYVGDYVPALRDLDPERWRDNKWVINITNEGPYFLFGSWIDAFSRIVFSVGLLSSLRSVRGLIAPQKPRRVAPVNIEQRSIAEVSIGIKMRSDTPGHGSRAVTFGHRSFCLIGLGILVAHLHSELRSRPPSYCGLGVWPWLASTPNCPTIELNCKNCEFDGRASEIDVFLNSFRVSGLRELSVRHCSHVEFVQELQTLRGIFLLSVYNLTVVRWEREAALSDESHPQLRKAVFSRVRFPNSTLPSALLPPRFPSLLEILKFEATNIETIPSDVHGQWPLSLNLEISMSDVKEVPLTLLKAEMNSLTLNFNRITSVPNEVLTSASVKVVGLSGNPIRELPENVERAAITLGSLSVVFTELEALPPWGFEPNNPDQFFVIWASGTPLCNAFEAANISVPNVICWMSVVQNASAAFLDSEGGEEEFW